MSEPIIATIASPIAPQATVAVGPSVSATVATVVPFSSSVMQGANLSAILLPNGVFTTTVNKKFYFSLEELTDVSASGAIPDGATIRFSTALGKWIIQPIAPASTASLEIQGNTGSDQVNSGETLKVVGVDGLETEVTDNEINISLPVIDGGSF